MVLSKYKMLFVFSYYTDCTWSPFYVKNLKLPEIGKKFSLPYSLLKKIIDIRLIFRETRKEDQLLPTEF